MRRAALPETSKGGLMVLGREYPTIATVIAVGPGTRTRDGVRHPITDVREGDEVTFDKFAIETRMVPGSEDLAILDYADCWLRIRREM